MWTKKALRTFRYVFPPSSVAGVRTEEGPDSHGHGRIHPSVVTAQS